MKLFNYEIQAQSGAARAGQYETAHGPFTTPLFMPVGTHATVKGVTIDGLHQLNSQVVLANTYHLYMRPGVDVVEQEDAAELVEDLAEDGLAERMLRAESVCVVVWDSGKETEKQKQGYTKHQAEQGLRGLPEMHVKPGIGWIRF